MNVVFMDLFVLIAVAFQKAAQSMGELSDIKAPNASTLISQEEIEEKIETAAEKKKRQAAEKKKKAEADKRKKAAGKNSGLVFTKNKTPKGKDERITFMKHWTEMSEADQKDYADGKIDSLKNPIVDADDSLNDDDFGADSPETEKLTEEKVRDIVKAYAKKNTKKKALAILASFGVKKVADLDADMFEEVVAEFE